MEPSWRHGRAEAWIFVGVVVLVGAVAFVLLLTWIN